MQGYRKLTTACCAAVLALGLAACGGGGSDDDTAMVCPAGQIGTYPDCMDPPTTYETAKAKIEAATTAADAQAAYDEVKDDVSATEGEMLQAAVDARIMAIDMAARAGMQQAALMTAAGMIDTSDLSTQALVDAARTAIAGLRQAIADAADVDDTSMYQTMLDNAVDAVDMAQGGIDTDTRRGNQMTALSDASDDLQAALAALSGVTPTQALLDAANNALTALNTAITGGADLTDDEKAPYQHEADNAAAPIRTAQNAFDDAEEDAEDTRLAEMAVTASRLRAGIGDTPLLATARSAAYGTGDNANDIAVTIDGGTPVNLSEDEDNPPGDLNGWTGMRFTAEPDGAEGTYEAVVYSYVGEPTVTEGQAFNVAYTANITDGVLAVTDVTDYQEQVASSSFDQSAGTKTFPLPDPNPQGASRINISGSFHGVPGNYICTPGTDQTCASTLAAEGFILGFTGTGTGGTWTFTPTNPETKLMDTSAPDNEYASYGWWLHKSEDGMTFTASAFAVNKGAVAAASGITALQGTATYVGGAAGKYALSSTTGGTNDAGHFTAKATLEADFGEDTVSGTIDNFMGADGEARKWSVELMASTVSDIGVIAGDPDTAGDTAAQNTVWTIDGTAGDAAGQWSGTLYENDATSGVPQVATGTFSSQFGREGRMVGAFGANEE